MRIIKYFYMGIKYLGFALYILIRYFIIGLLTILLSFPYYFINGIQVLFSKEKKKDLGFSRPVFPTIMMMISLCTYFLSIFILSRWFVQSERIKKMTESVLENTIILENDSMSSTSREDIDENDYISTDVSYNNISFIDVDFNSLINRNSDTVAWLQVSGTNINYPVVQSSNNNYYLEHDINNYETNVGWIFGDYRNSFDSFGRNTIIYGHNLTNKTMFGSLPWVLNSDWYTNENNYYIKMATVNCKIIWKVFSIYKIDPVVDYLKTSFHTDDEFSQWINEMSNRSIYNFGESVSFSDKVLTLSTCDDIGTRRVVVQAKMISIEYK